MKRLSHTSPFPFGQHKDTKMEDMRASYLLWIYGATWGRRWPNIIAYIDQHYALIKEREKQERKNGGTPQ